MISAVVVTRNSEKELGDCLASVQDFAQEIVIVDLNSSDKTLEVAKKYGAKIVDHEPVIYVELVRQFAFDQASGDWIILLDPDERLTIPLKDELQKIGDDVAAVNIPRKNIFFGKWVRHTNFWPDRQIRFFQKGKIVWSTVIHSYPAVNGKVVDLAASESLAIEHYGYRDYDEFFSRQNRYSTVAATGKFSLVNLFWQPTREFLVRYVKHLGFLDGFLGLSLVYSLAIYQLMVQVKQWEKTRNSSA